MKILIVEDDIKVNSFIAKGLSESGHVIDSSHDGESGLELASTNKYDVIILDQMLPKIHGLDILKEIRANNNSTPVLILSALSKVDDRVKGLRAGGDDYLTKPFAFAELLARIEVLGKRSSPTSTTKIKAGDLEIDLLARKAFRNGETIDLQTREFILLEYLIKNKGQLITRTMILESVWEYNFDPQTNIIDVHISRLRKKIGDDGTLIKTVRGAGYIVEEIS